MTETELRVAAVISGLITLGGLGITAWAIKAEEKLFFAQGMFVLMLGLTLLALSLLPEGILRTSLAVALSIGAMAWVPMYLKILRDERRKPDGTPSTEG
jgi:hypothetical protein